jgi:hypothetical protein
MARILQINAKCSDMFCAALAVDGKQVGDDYDGYVPDFMPGEHFGDYVMLNIDIDTGKIVKWHAPSEEELNHVFNVGGEDDENS